MFSPFKGVTGDNRTLDVTLILPLRVDMPIYVSPELFPNMYCWSSLQGSWCETDPHSLSVTPGKGWIELGTRINLSCWHLLLGTHWLQNLLLWLCMWRYGSESGDLIVQFTLNPQSSQIRVCIVHHMLKGPPGMECSSVACASYIFICQHV